MKTLARVVQAIEQAVTDRYVNIDEAKEIGEAIAASAKMNSANPDFVDQLAEAVDRGLDSVVVSRFSERNPYISDTAEKIIDQAITDASHGKLGFSKGYQTCGPFGPTGVFRWHVAGNHRWVRS